MHYIPRMDQTRLVKNATCSIFRIIFNRKCVHQSILMQKDVLYSKPGSKQACKKCHLQHFQNKSQQKLSTSITIKYGCYGGKGGVLGTQLYPLSLGYGATFTIKRPRRGQIKRQMTLITLKDPEEGK